MAVHARFVVHRVLTPRMGPKSRETVIPRPFLCPHIPAIVARFDLPASMLPLLGFFVLGGAPLVIARNLRAKCE